MAKREAKHAAEGFGTQVDSKTSHDVIRAQNCPVPVMEIEKTALAPKAPGNAEVRHNGGSPACGRRPAAANARPRSNSYREGKPSRRVDPDLGFAASHNDVKSWHSVPPDGESRRGSYRDAPSHRQAGPRANAHLVQAVRRFCNNGGLHAAVAQLGRKRA
jgi:hypothetical protein